MTQGERVKELRSSLRLTLEKFGERLGVQRSAVSKIERGERNLTDQMAISICREFNVNKNWLLNGEGDMFLPTDRNTEIARLTRQLLDEESDSFKNRLISVLSNLTADQWELLADIAENLTQKKD